MQDGQCRFKSIQGRTHFVLECFERILENKNNKNLQETFSIFYFYFEDKILADVKEQEKRRGRKTMWANTHKLGYHQHHKVGMAN